MRRTTAALVMLLGVYVAPLPAQDQNTPRISSADVEVQRGVGASGSDNTLTERGTARPGGYGSQGPIGAGTGCDGCGGYACHPQGCIFRKVLIWATYCPKERLGCCHNFCNSCQYKGVEPLYLFFLNPKCFEGGIHRPTFTNECYRGCKGCATGHP